MSTPNNVQSFIIVNNTQNDGGGGRKININGVLFEQEKLFELVHLLKNMPQEDDGKSNIVFNPPTISNEIAQQEQPTKRHSEMLINTSLNDNAFQETNDSMLNMDDILSPSALMIPTPTPLNAVMIQDYDRSKFNMDNSPNNEQDLEESVTTPTMIRPVKRSRFQSVEDQDVFLSPTTCMRYGVPQSFEATVANHQAQQQPSQQVHVQQVPILQMPPSKYEHAQQQQQQVQQQQQQQYEQHVQQQQQQSSQPVQKIQVKYEQQSTPNWTLTEQDIPKLKVLQSLLEKNITYSPPSLNSTPMTPLSGNQMSLCSPVDENYISSPVSDDGFGSLRISTTKFSGQKRKSPMSVNSPTNERQLICSGTPRRKNKKHHPADNYCMRFTLK
ncbi:developmentally-regulated protein [Acrasis kona]|uniref:Developmentally-regulated protein n=1 Tax=Acrasis kona TaxID=1008807 RepID=A0AAW2Z6S1_9EUKA